MPDVEGSSTALVICDHGSRRADAHVFLQTFVRSFEQESPFIVEPAHMELAEPSIAEAFDRCVVRGATLVVIAPLFFWPGKHWTEDIPTLAAAAAARHPGIDYLVAGPIGTSPLLAELVRDRIDACIAHANGGPSCTVCRNTTGCRRLPGGESAEGPFAAR